MRAFIRLAQAKPDALRGRVPVDLCAYARRGTKAWPKTFIGQRVVLEHGCSGIVSELYDNGTTLSGLVDVGEHKGSRFGAYLLANWTETWWILLPEDEAKEESERRRAMRRTRDGLKGYIPIPLEFYTRLGALQGLVRACVFFKDGCQGSILKILKNEDCRVLIHHGPHVGTAVLPLTTLASRGSEGLCRRRVGRRILPVVYVKAPTEDP